MRLMTYNTGKNVKLITSFMRKNVKLMRKNVKLMRKNVKLRTSFIRLMAYNTGKILTL